jgi:hypothetical protein
VTITSARRSGSNRIVRRRRPGSLVAQYLGRRATGRDTRKRQIRRSRNRTGNWIRRSRNRASNSTAPSRRRISNWTGRRTTGRGRTEQQVAGSNPARAHFVSGSWAYRLDLLNDQRDPCIPTKLVVYRLPGAGTRRGLDLLGRTPEAVHRRRRSHGRERRRRQVAQRRPRVRLQRGAGSQQPLPLNPPASDVPDARPSG